MSTTTTHHAPGKLFTFLPSLSALKIIFVFLFLCTVKICASQVQIEWQKCLGGTTGDYFSSIQQTSDGCYIGVGRVTSNDGNVTGNHGIDDVWVIKLDSLGNLLWQKCFGGSNGDYASSIQQTADGGYIVAGMTQSNDGDVSGNHGGQDSWIFKIDSLGNIIWQKCLGGTNNEQAGLIQQTTNGGYIMTGVTNSNDGNITGNHGSGDSWVVKLDPLGNIIWQKCFGGSLNDATNSIQQLNDGGYIIAGNTSSNDGNVSGNHGGSDSWIFKIDSLGNIIWQKCFGGTNDESTSAQQTADDGFILGGFTRSNDGNVTGNHGGSDSWILKIDSLGNIIWQKCFGGTLNDGTSSIKQLNDGGYISAGYAYSNDGDVNGNHGGSDFWILRLDSLGNLIWQKCLGGSGSYDVANTVQQTNDVGFIVGGHTQSNDGDVSGNHGFIDWWVVKFSELPIQGKVYNDLNQSCIQDSTEIGIRGFSVLINPGSYISQTTGTGYYFLETLPLGTYTATIDTTNHLWLSSCPVTQSFSVTDTNVITEAPSFGLYSTQPCSDPDISIIAPILRRCMTGLIYLKAENKATATGLLDTAYAVVHLDSLITIQTASIPYTNLGSNLYRFDLGDIAPGQHKTWTIEVLVSCAAMNNQTLCMDATLYPIQSCIYSYDTIPDSPPGPTGDISTCDLPWDKSSLSVDGWCQNDSVYFTITNTGDPIDGDMDCWAPVRIYIDGVLTEIDSIQLQGGQTITYVFAGNGLTWRLEADQHPLHPGNSHPNAVVEFCGDTLNWTPGGVTAQYQDDEDPVVDIYCGMVTGSYDPNDKTGYPTGTGPDRYVYQNQQIQYVVRFQNTGNDTAFTVIVRDTLDENFNIFTVTPGCASHDYTFQMYGPRVLEWKFNNILLPDSNVNEPASHGFLTFTVDQNPDLPFGTQLLNKAAIYFDFNDAVITNQTIHTLYDFSVVLSALQPIVSWNEQITVYPNPATSNIAVTFPELQENSELILMDISGKRISTIPVSSGESSLTMSIADYPPGLYFVVLYEAKKVSIGKLVVD